MDCVRARRGQGVSLAYDAMVRETIAKGHLVRLFDTVTIPMVIYSLAYPEARENDPAIREFRNWIIDEVSTDGTCPNTVGATA
jgi:LysR family transcriptional regulator, glycine cleavage system transcriptional activator